MAEILVILSEGLTPINQLSSVTTKRLEAGLKEWNQGKYSAILVTGGIFLPPNVQTRPIAAIMREWLEKAGVPGDCILVEDASKDSFENMRFGTAILANHGYDPSFTKLTIVSQWQHVLRTRYTASKYGWVTKSVNLFYSIGVKGVIMECIFLLVHLADPLGTGFIARKNRRERTYN